MNAPARLAAFGVALVATLGVGAGLGATIGPDASTDAPGQEEAAPAPIGDGVLASVDGYRLVPASGVLDGAGGTFRFVIDGPDGSPVEDYATIHDRELHLIVVDQELTSFEHVHPDRAPDGTWSVDLPALAPGSYRAIADFMVAGGPRLALGTALSVAGSYEPRELAEPSSTATVDGYEVRLTIEPGDDAEVTATLVVSRNGEPVELEPYLGADGHLVALRAGDLAYAHVHPTTDAPHPATPGTVAFGATLTAGRYALFLDFKHDGVVRTAAFTVDQHVVGATDDMEHGADG